MPQCFVLVVNLQSACSQQDLSWFDPNTLLPPSLQVLEGPSTLVRVEMQAVDERFSDQMGLGGVLAAEDRSFEDQYPNEQVPKTVQNLMELMNEVRLLRCSYRCPVPATYSSVGTLTSEQL